MIYAKVVNSTFDLLEGPKPLKHGLAVIANRQIKGRGRGQNSWLSPEGCAMTSFQLQYSPSSKQGQNSSLLQHLVSLAVVHSLKGIFKSIISVTIMCSIDDLTRVATHHLVTWICLHFSILIKCYYSDAGTSAGGPLALPIFC